MNQKKLATRGAIGVVMLLGMLMQAQAVVTLDPAVSQAIADGIATVLLVVGLGGGGVGRQVM